MSRLTSALSAVLAAAVLAVVFAAPALATEEIESFSTTISTTQAGGHPDVVTSFALHDPGAPESARNVILNTPAGIFGDPQAVPQCSSLDLALQQCPSSSQVGLITVRADYEGNSNYLLGTAPIYDMEVPASQTANFAFIIPTLNIPINIPVSVRTSGDYGLRFSVSNLTQSAPLASANMTFWGFPADETHDAQRFPKGSLGKPAGCVGKADTSCTAGVESPITERPLTINPTVCTGQPLTTTLEVETYQDPGRFITKTSSFEPITGCQKQVFKPVLFVQPTTEEADSASGLDLELRTEQFLGFAAAPSELRSAVVTLPEGLTINPDAADGQSACTDAQANFGSEGPASCPDSSKIGTASIESPALSATLEGSLYIGEPKPGDQYRIFMMTDGSGIHSKLVGSVRPDPATGQVHVYFTDLPQVPFSNYSVHLFASDRGLMATPIVCSAYASEGEFQAWNAVLPEVKSAYNFAIESGPHGAPCPGQVRPFHPRLAAGTSSSVAGRFSSFILRLDRDDGDQFLGDLNFRMPPGFTGDLRGISYCPERAIAEAATKLGRAEEASPSCPASSQIGTSNVAAGPGDHPFHVVGKIYLAGPFKGAPLSLVAITPALAGPYDYGVVLVRVALHVDPQTAQVSAVSDTMPSIIGGIPIRLRSIQVNIDREHFTINPTNCSRFTVDSQGIGDQGTVTDFSSFFHVVNCRSLPFKPTMSVRLLGGRKNTRRGVDPALQFDLRTREGDANIKSLAVTLPNAFEIDQEHLGNICTEKELLATQCAGRQKIGEATTTTPLLDQPLSGPVYAVSGSGGLPRLAFILDGQVSLVPRAETTTIKNQRLQTVVPVVPDAAIGHFHLVIFGGKRGYLTNTRDLCAHTPVLEVAYGAQNGKALAQRVKVKAACGKQAKARHKRHR